MDEQEQADRMAAAEALFMISTRGRKNKSDATARRSKRGRKKKEINEYYDDKGDRESERIGESPAEDEVKLIKSKRGQLDDSVTSLTEDFQGGKVRTAGKKFGKFYTNNDALDNPSQSKMPRPSPSPRKKKTKADNSLPSLPSSSSSTSASASNSFIINEFPMADTRANNSNNKKLGKGKTGKVKAEQKADSKEEIKALGFTGMPVTLSELSSKSPPRIPVKYIKTGAASPRKSQGAIAERDQRQMNVKTTVELKSTDSSSSSLPPSANLLSMNLSTPDLPSLPAGIGSLQLPSSPIPNLSSLSESKAASSSREESQKQLPLKKRKLHSTAQVEEEEEEKVMEDISDAEEEVLVGSVGQVQATYTVQAPPIITMQTLMEIKTALTPDEDGDLPLHIAVVHENMRMVTKLINLMRIAFKGVDKFNKQQQTPLHLAVKLNFVPAVDLLITSGANINTVDCTGSSAIHMAVQGGFYDCLQLILKRCPQAEFNARNFEGLSPLHLAVSNRDTKQVQLLLNYGVDIDLPDGKSGRTAVFHSAETNQKNLVELLLKQGANPELPNYAGVTTTMAAQGRNLHSILKLIGSVVQDKQESKWSPTITVKNHSGSVMEVNQSAVSGVSTTGANLTDKTKAHRNMIMISESRRKSVEGSSSQSSSLSEQQTTIETLPSLRIPSMRLPSLNLSSLPPPTNPAVKMEVTDLLNSNGSFVINSSSSSSSSRHGPTTALRSLPLSSSSSSSSSIPVINVKQEIKETSVDDSGERFTTTTSSALSSSLSSLSRNEYIVVSKPTSLPYTVTGGMEGNKSVHKIQIPTNLSRNIPAAAAAAALSNVSSTSATTASSSSSNFSGNPMRQVSLLQQISAAASQQQDSNKLSLPSSSSSPIMLSSLSSKPSSPRSPAASTANNSNSNSDTLTLTSTQARLYKRLLEMCNINPDPSVHGGGSCSMPSSPPVLKSLPILPSSLSSPSLSARLSSSPLNDLSSIRSTPSPLSVISNPATKSGHFPLHHQHHHHHHHNPSQHQDKRKHPFLLQRSISTQEASRQPMQTNSRTPPQKVSILRVSDPNFDSSGNNNNNNDEIHMQRSQVIHRVSSPHNLTSNLYSSISSANSDVPLNLSAKSSSKTSSFERERGDNSNYDNNNKSQQEIFSTVVSPSHSSRERHSRGAVAAGDKTRSKSSSPTPNFSSYSSTDKLSVQKSRNNPETVIREDGSGLVVVPEFPHITKSVSAETASFVRNFLSQQKHHLQQNQQQHQQQHQQYQHKQFDKQNGPRSFANEAASSSSSQPGSPPSSSALLDLNLTLKQYPRTLKSINIPPLLTATSTSLLSSSSSPSSLSLPGSPISSLSILPSIPLSHLPEKKYLSLSRNSVAGLVTHGLIDEKGIISASSPPTTTTATTAANNNNNNNPPSFLHQQGGRVIDLSTGDDSRSGHFQQHDRPMYPSDHSNDNNNGSSIGSSSSNNMEGKMVGFSGAIISIPSSSIGIEKDKSSSFNKNVADNSKTGDKPLSSTTLTTLTTAATTTTAPPMISATKDKVKRKGRKAGGGGGGGAKSSQSPPTLMETPPSQNKINSETDQRLKKFLGMKRTESISTTSTISSSSSSLSTLTSDIKNRIKKQKNRYSESVTGKVQSSSEITGTNNEKSNKFDIASSHQEVPGSGYDHHHDNEPTIETVGIFSGSIQHVKVKSNTLKSLPPSFSSFSSSSSSSFKTGSRKSGSSLAATAASTVVVDDEKLPNPVTLSSWPMSGKQLASSSSISVSTLSSTSPTFTSSNTEKSLENIKNERSKIKVLEISSFSSDKFEESVSVVGSGSGNNDDSKNSLDEGGDSSDTYYRERIVWASSPLPLPLPLPAQISENQELSSVTNSATNVSRLDMNALPKVREDESDNVVVADSLSTSLSSSSSSNVVTAAVILKPVQESNAGSDKKRKKKRKAKEEKVVSGGGNSSSGVEIETNTYKKGAKISTTKTTKDVKDYGGAGDGDVIDYETKILQKVVRNPSSSVVTSSSCLLSDNADTNNERLDMKVGGDNDNICDNGGGRRDEDDDDDSERGHSAIQRQKHAHKHQQEADDYDSHSNVASDLSGGCGGSAGAGSGGCSKSSGSKDTDKEERYGGGGGCSSSGSSSGGVVIDQRSNSGADYDDVDMPNRLSMEEERELVIDL